MAALLLPSFMWAQANPVTSTSGIVVFNQASVESTGTTITDSRGQFVFNAVDLQGNTSKSLRQYNGVTKAWKVAAKGQEDLLLILGRADPDKITPGKMLEAIYWKDQSGAYWCVASIDANDFTDPVQLEEIWQSEGKFSSLENAQGKQLLGAALPISIRYK